MKNLLSLIMFLVLVFMAVVGCSNDGKNPTSPQGLAPDSYDIPLGEEPDGNHQVWGVWNLIIDVENQTVTLVPETRDVEHLNISTLIPAPTIQIMSFNPSTRMLEVDMTIRNPYTITGYDVRGILYTNNNGLMLKNADGWTSTFDKPGGLPINPFKAYNKFIPLRAFGPVSQSTERFSIYFPEPSGTIQWAVTASYPGNCYEPYMIANFDHEEITSEQGSSAIASVAVYDWQQTVNSVGLLAQAITNQQIVWFSLDHGITWEGTIQNMNGVAAGTYSGLIVAISNDAGGLYAYDFVNIVVTKANIPDNPIDVTPDHLNFCVKDVSIFKKFAYVASSYSGFHVFDLTDEANPKWLKKIELSGQPQALTIYGEYAFVVGSALDIVDISDPYNPNIVKTVFLPGPYSMDIVVYSGYAYIAQQTEGLRIVDIEPIEDAYLLSTVDTPGSALGLDIDVAKNNVYLADGNEGLQIIDVASHPPIIIKNVPMANATSAQYYNGYAFVCNGASLEIVDVDPVESANIVSTVSTLSYGKNVLYKNGFCYVADYYQGLCIIDVDPPSSASKVSQVDMGGLAINASMTLSLEYVYVACDAGGIGIVDVTPPSTAFLANTVFTPGIPQDVFGQNGYAYVADGYGGFLTVDVAPPENSDVLYSYATNSSYSGITSGVEYVYACAGWGGLDIFDIASPGSPLHVKNVAGIPANEVAYENGYAHIVCGTDGVDIVDVYPVNLSAVVRHIDTPTHALGIAVQMDYVYVACHSEGLLVIDITIPELAYIAHTVPTTGTFWDVAVQGNYAYVANAAGGLEIIEITNPLAAHVVNTVSSGSGAYGVDIQGDYAYLAAYGAGLQIIDVDPVSEAAVIASVPCPRGAFEVSVDGNMAYVCASEGGLRIIQLW